MELSTLFLGSGFALFIALLAWGNQIREPRKEIRNLENEFRMEFDLNKSEVNPLIRDRDSKKNVKKYTFTDTNLALISIMEKNTLQDAKRVGLLKKLKELNKTRQELENHYKGRYILTLILTFLLFIFGSISLYTSDMKIDIQPYSFSVNNIFFLIVLTVMVIITINLVIAYTKEEAFIKKMSDISDDIEG